VNRAFWLGVAVSIVTGALVNELGQVAPRLARRLAVVAARVWAGSDLDLARVYEEEWVAVIEDAPGQLTKLFHALRLLCGAMVLHLRRRAGIMADAFEGAPLSILVVAFMLPVVVCSGMVFVAAAVVLGSPHNAVVTEAMVVALAACAVCSQLLLLDTRRAMRARQWSATVAGSAAIGCALLSLSLEDNSLAVFLQISLTTVPGCMTVLLAWLRPVRAYWESKPELGRSHSLLAMLPLNGYAFVAVLVSRRVDDVRGVVAMTACVVVGTFVTAIVLRRAGSPAQAETTDRVSG
jgi:hypothetical protein